MTPRKAAITAAVAVVLASLLIVSTIPASLIRAQEDEEWSATINGAAILGGTTVVIEINGFKQGQDNGQIDTGTVTIGGTITAEVVEGWVHINKNLGENPVIFFDGQLATEEGEGWFRVMADIGEEVASLELVDVYGIVDIWVEDFPGDDETMFENRAAGRADAFRAVISGSGTLDGFEVPKPKGGTITLEAQGEAQYKKKSYTVAIAVEAEYEFNPSEPKWEKQIQVTFIGGTVTVTGENIDATYEIWGKKVDDATGLKFILKLWDEGGDINIGGTLYDDTGTKAGKISNIRFGFQGDELGRWIFDEAGEYPTEFENVRVSISLTKPLKLSLKTNTSGSLTVTVEEEA